MSFFEDASLVLIPSAIKDQKVYSVKPTDGTGDLTFSRASNATRVASNGLIEKVRTNSILQSQTFDTASWTNVNTTITANTSAAPDGTLTADRLTDDATNAAHIIASAINWPTAERTCSLFVKQGTANKVYIANATSGFGVFFNLSTATIDGTIGSITGTITSLPNGWYRITATHTAASASTLGFGIYETYTGTYATTTEYIGTSKSLELWGAQLETGDIATDYIATTSAAVSVGPVSGLPRLDYLNSSCPRLLLEPQRTNLALQSESATTSVTNVGYTATSNVATSPDGFASADLLLEDTSTLHLLQKEFSVASTTDSYAVSFFVKANGRTSGRILYGVNGAPFSSVYAIFNLTAGTITAASADAPAVAGTSKIENYGNGWYRVSVSGVIGTAGTHYARIQDNNGGVAGDPTKGFQVWGFQAELGSYATSYIPTLGTSVTRVADAASKTSASALIGQTEGTLFAEVEVINTMDNIGIWLRQSGSLYNNIILMFFDGSRNSRLQIINGGLSQVDIFGPVVSAGFHKIAAAYKANDFVLYVDGVQVGLDAAGSVPTCNEIYIDTYIDAGQRNATKKQVVIFPTRLSNSDLAALTA